MRLGMVVSKSFLITMKGNERKALSASSLSVGGVQRILG